MKKMLLFSLLIISFSTFVSCNDTIDPKTTPVDGSVFYCIINSDTTFQTAYLSQTYDVSGVNPLENTTDPAMNNARVLITYKGSKFLFTDSSIGRTDNSRYKDNFQFYYNNNLNMKSSFIKDIAYPCSVKVTLPNNKTLSSVISSIPTGDLFFGNYVYSFPVEDYVKMCEFTWNFSSTKNSLNNYYFLPELEINYSKVENGIPVRKKAKIPYMTYYANGEEVPVYPKVTKTSGFMLNKQYIIDAFNEISANDSQKGNYIIHNLTFSIILMDKNLAAYYASNSTYNDEFSVRIDAADYSNISGGSGLFGIYATKKKDIKLDSAYVAGLGYRYEPKL